MNIKRSLNKLWALNLSILVFGCYGLEELPEPEIRHSQKFVWEIYTDTINHFQYDLGRVLVTRDGQGMAFWVKIDTAEAFTFTVPSSEKLHSGFAFNIPEQQLTHTALNTTFVVEGTPYSHIRKEQWYDGYLYGREDGYVMFGLAITFLDNAFEQYNQTHHIWAHTDYFNEF